MDIRIEKQVEFLYGIYYEKVLNGEIIYIEKDTPGNHIDFISNEINNFSDVDSVIQFVEKQKQQQNYGGHSPSFIIKYLYYFYNSKKGDTIFRFNLHDAPYTNNCNNYYGFYIGHSRYIPSDSHKSILTPYFWHKDMTLRYGNKNDSDFTSKSDKLIFRGGTNGNPDFPKREYNNTTRYQIISTNFDKYEGIDVCFSHETPHSLPMYGKFVKTPMSLNEIFSHKFVLCINGNDWSSLFPEVLALSNCCPFHTYPFDFEDYYFYDLKPYVHFIPVKVDGTDLYSQYDWCLKNLDKCREISENGTKYMSFYGDPNTFEKIVQRFCELYPIVKYK